MFNTFHTVIWLGFTNHCNIKETFLQDFLEILKRSNASEFLGNLEEKFTSELDMNTLYICQA